ncbi:hypothetical protein O7632_25990 [Solwaraspora sp. WMMD406]|uniref:hypothetical protein n=1 Tax=Solwaraspora sp. WMMD406 TaxID=3016095 RepID=UPI002417B95C|nr:hypothetical protein [Solwaraspora sp. WMMD406]MDG4767514.1 hypothetical protein [Solwaraspora sp. WMMD406]
MGTKAGSSSLSDHSHPRESSTRQLGRSAWATLLGASWLAVALVGLSAIRSGQAPGWYEPMLVGSGLVGIASAAVGFLITRRRRVTVALLLTATALLAAAAGVTAATP